LKTNVIMDNIFITLTHYSINNDAYPWYIPNRHTGVGNMLFQISAGIAYAAKHNRILYVPGLETYLKLENLDKYDTIFRNINSECPPEYLQVVAHPIKLSGEENREYILDIKPFGNMNFFGYFENYRNLIEYRSAILDCFRPPSYMISYIHKVFPVVLEENVCSIHVRLGSDYFEIDNLRRQLGEFQRGYLACVDHMLQTKNIKKFVVLTDNREYCQYIFDQNPKYEGIEFIYSDEKDYIDIWIISLIKNNIVSVSTLAWWGSFLNEHADQYVVCYETNRPDLHYPGWIVVPQADLNKDD